MTQVRISRILTIEADMLQGARVGHTQISGIDHPLTHFNQPQGCNVTTLMPKDSRHLPRRSGPRVPLETCLQPRVKALGPNFKEDHFFLILHPNSMQDQARASPNQDPKASPNPHPPRDTNPPQQIMSIMTLFS